MLAVPRTGDQAPSYDGIGNSESTSTILVCLFRCSNMLRIFADHFSRHRPNIGIIGKNAIVWLA